MPTQAESDAAFTAAKAQIIEVIENEAGFFASTLEGDITDADIRSVSDAALTAAEAVHNTAQPQTTTITQRS